MGTVHDVRTPWFELVLVDR